MARVFNGEGPGADQCAGILDSFFFFASWEEKGFKVGGGMGMGARGTSF